MKRRRIDPAAAPFPDLSAVKIPPSVLFTAVKAYLTILFSFVGDQGINRIFFQTVSAV